MNNYRLNDNRISGYNCEEEGLPMNTDHCVLDTSAVARANALVTQTGILEKFAKWKQGRAAARAPFVSERAILVGLLLLAWEQSPLLLTNLADLLCARLTAQSRQLLGLTHPDSAEGTGERARWYDRTRAAFERLVALMDPYPMSASAQSFTQVRAVLDGHDVVREATMKARLREFTEAFLLVTFAQQPQPMREASSQIDLTIDQIFVQSPAGAGYSRRNLERRVTEEAVTGRPSPAFRPVEVFAGWKRDSGTEAEESAGRTHPAAKRRWGWMLNIAVRVDSVSPDTARVPAMVVAATLSMPGVGIAEEALHLMRSALGTGLKPGIVHADNTYFATQPIERMHIPTAELGFTPLTDYRTDRLGVHEFKQGAMFIEGKAYCPEMPVPLENASIEFRKGAISVETYRLRLQERTRFELRPKGKPDQNGRYRLTHPAGILHGYDRASERLGQACAQQSVTFDRADRISHRQALPYMSSAWEASHRHASLTFEAFNARFHSLSEDLGAPSRRIRGFAAAQILATIRIANYNRKTVARYLDC